ncbi:MAG TPA: hypothetical protein VJ936_06200 [Desulfobacteraceae bacterium]|nr:hypothetical protein [Desulfobacteraceae bacterium]
MDSSKETFLQLQQEARKIVAELPAPEFERVFPDEIATSQQHLDGHPVLSKLEKQIAGLIEDDFGHGLLHSRLVARDAGALVRIELTRHHGSHAAEKEVRRTTLLVQTAALLHDIKRKEKKHSEKGAVFAKTFLKQETYPFDSREITTVCDAIREHEAFQHQRPTIKKNVQASLVSDALYDADKFRWGPDNFTHTVWDMVIFSRISLEEFLKRYPGGMKKLSQIKKTFRTPTGKIYGPGFISLGIEAGERLLEVIQKKYT